MANRKAARIIALGGIVIAVGVGGPGPLARLLVCPLAVDLEAAS